MRIGMFAAGAVGGYFGARLAEAGEEVVLVARGEHLRAIRESGLHVESPAGNLTLRPVAASDDPAELGPVDCVLVAVKTWQLPEAAEAMRPLLGKGTFVVPLLNGVEAPDILGGVLGTRWVLGGLCRIFAMLVGPGRVRHAGFNPSVQFGELDGHVSERAEALLKAFEGATGVTASIAEDVNVAMWEKLLFVEPLGAVGAVTRAPMAVLRGIPETRALVEGAMHEVQAVAVGRGVPVSGEAVARALSVLDDLMASGTASMQRDIMDGRPSELDGQTGAVVRLGREAGVPVPIHEFLYGALAPQEGLARGEVDLTD